MNWRAIKSLRVALLSFLLTALCPFGAQGDEQCQTIRLDQAGQSFSKIPVYDQRGAETNDPNTCYAVVSAELIDDYRFFLGDPLNQITSPFWVILNYKTALEKMEIEDMAKIDS